MRAQIPIHSLCLAVIIVANIATIRTTIAAGAPEAPIRWLELECSASIEPLTVLAASPDGERLLVGNTYQSEAIVVQVDDNTPTCSLEPRSELSWAQPQPPPLPGMGVDRWAVVPNTHVPTQPHAPGRPIVGSVPQCFEYTLAVTAPEALHVWGPPQRGSVTIPLPTPIKNPQIGLQASIILDEGGRSRGVVMVGREGRWRLWISEPLPGSITADRTRCPRSESDGDTDVEGAVNDVEEQP